MDRERSGASARAITLTRSTFPFTSLENLLCKVYQGIKKRAIAILWGWHCNNPDAELYRTRSNTISIWKKMHFIGFAALNAVELDMEKSFQQFYIFRGSHYSRTQFPFLFSDRWSIPNFSFVQAVRAERCQFSQSMSHRSGERKICRTQQLGVYIFHTLRQSRSKKSPEVGDASASATHEPLLVCSLRPPE